MPFLDLKKKKWIIKDLELPVIEDVPMKDLKWFKEKMIEADEMAKEGKQGTKEEVAFENEWFDNVCKIGLGSSLDEIENSGISTPDFRLLMAEVYTFLSICGTIEGAKQSGLYEVETPKKEK